MGDRILDVLIRGDGNPQYNMGGDGKPLAIKVRGQASAINDTVAIDPNDPKVIDIGKWAVTEYNKRGKPELQSAEAVLQNAKAALERAKAEVERAEAELKRVKGLELEFESIDGGYKGNVFGAIHYWLAINAKNSQGSDNYQAAVLDKSASNLKILLRFGPI